MKWKIYAWLIGVLFLGPLIADPEIGELSDIKILRYIITTILILGTFCFAYQKVILNQTFWKFVLVIAAIDELFGLFEVIENNEFGALFVFTLVIGYGLIIPAFIAVYLYSFESNELWAKRQTNPKVPK